MIRSPSAPQTHRASELMVETAGTEFGVWSLLARTAWGRPMTDRLTREQRSAQMARIRSRNTKPEWAIRRLLHQMGYRYRLHAAGLPGRPDLAFPSRRKVIFVHG